MSKMTLQSLGRKLQEKRANRGIREVATEIGVSAATLSRVETGRLPDLETFRKVCDWLRIDASEVLGIRHASSDAGKASVHFRKKEALAPDTAAALAQMILSAQRALLRLDHDES
ncbi:MAG TPA: helix-turn-helix transcriptional regulator [Candidatus Hydrogenedentes bacterium]|nr:helix-turn-helix transcriptional regulator [Candidatus Hydrogenedentota bacterium]